MGASSCVACGECVQACPTGALMPARDAGLAQITRRSTRSARIAASAASSPGTSGTNTDRIHFVTGRDGPANHGRLCVKGRYGFDYIHNEAA